MSKKIIAPIAAVVLLALAGAAQAATKTASFTVSATVAKNCIIRATDMDFGTFDLDDVSNRTTTSNILVRCTNGTNYEVRLSLPIFVAPTTVAEPRLEWSAASSAEGSLALTARNAGNNARGDFDAELQPVRHRGAGPNLGRRQRRHRGDLGWLRRGPGTGQ